MKFLCVTILAILTVASAVPAPDGWGHYGSVYSVPSVHRSVAVAPAVYTRTHVVPVRPVYHGGAISQGYGFGNAGYGNAGYGHTGYGNVGYGNAGWRNSGFNHGWGHRW
ncbi:uncharacterized protein [Diabrotica undecimpunctata]|uniref:uncharacterized protein n=1 Tax=Diabrotica undecimpunctata TaxID=50387 RepID=UPI003B639281